jgi:uncharacterized membrane protein
MHMFGWGQGLITPGDNVGPSGWHMVEAGTHLDPLGIVCMVLGLILWAAVVTTLVLVMVHLVRRLRCPKTGPGAADSQAGPARAGGTSKESEALRLLDERYARGEINHKEYLERKSDLTVS